MADRAPGELSLFLHRVRDFVKRAPVTCRPNDSVVAVAKLLSREGVGSVIVVDGDGTPMGVVTDRDLRRKVLAAGRDPRATAVASIMSAPLVTIRPAAFAFEAVLEMTRREIHHLGVIEDGRLVGVISSHDVMTLQTIHPVMLAREIATAVSIDALAALAGRVTALVRRLVEEGGTTHDIGQVVAELNDRMVLRVLGLAAGALEELGQHAPPVSYCWLTFGSEARREQTLRTDQDNGLVYADPPAAFREHAAEYYARLAAEAIRGLIAIGFPPCPGGAMASNPRWCQPLSVWADYFERWIEGGSPEQVLAASIYFDLRPLVGATELAAELRRIIHREAPARRVFLRLLARDVVIRRLPLTVFGNIAVQRSEPHRGTVDVKAGGGLQLVGAGRLHGLELALDETNTIERFRAAARHSIYTAEHQREITDAYQHLMRLRLVHQLEQLDRGIAPDNQIHPERLSHADRLLFRDALKTVAGVQAVIRERFATDLVPGL